MRVLVVDDNTALAENIAEILSDAGHQALTAFSAEAGLLAVEAGGIDGLITDYRLPGRNGAELIAELRQRGSRVPAVVITAHTDEETVSSARGAGALAVLGKPLDLEALMSTVEAMGEA